MLTIDKNLKKLKCFFKEGTYEGKEYDTKGELFGTFTMTIKYEFDKGYLLLKVKDYEEKYFLNGTGLNTDNGIEKWCINKNILCRVIQDTTNLNLVKSIQRKKTCNLTKNNVYYFDKTKNKYILQGYSIIKFIK
jgi:hypothetical protein